MTEKDRFDGKQILEEKELAEKVTEIRREIHRRPGLSGCEQETVRYICSWLEEANIPYEVMLEGCAVTAVLKGEAPGAEHGPVIGLRADMDALPIQEKTGLAFTSEIPGVMHACGHDAHAAILLGTAMKLSQLRDQLPGTVKFFFQPNEEDEGGAERMIQAGCLENPHVDYVLGIHVEPRHKTGQIGIRYGKMMAASDMIDLTIHGKGAHGAHPNEGVDAIMVAANILNTVQTVVSRRVSPLESAVCSFGKISGGTARNQIADEVKLQGIIRTLDPQQRIFVREQVKNIAESVGKSMGAEVEFHVTESYGPTINDDWVTAMVEKNAEELVGRSNIILEKEPDMGTEDFSYFTMERPSCFFHLGCYSEKVGPYVDLHNSAFTLDEDCLILGVAMQVQNVLALMDGGK